MLNNELKPIPLLTYNDDHHGKGIFYNDPHQPYYKYIDNTSFAKFFISKDVTKSLPVRNPKDDFARRDVTRVYWLGHATCLIQFNDIFIITDPIFSRYASPVPLTIKRKTPAPCEIKDLPPISVILISHDHYDHCDYNSLKEICKLNPDVKIFAPLGTSDMIKKWHFDNVIEFDWRQYVQYKDILILCFPARHGSCRTGFDRDVKLWCSWHISDEKQKIDVYFPGDTAVGPHFEELRNTLYKQIDLAMMPIGPIEPRGMMRTVHMDSKDAYEMNLIMCPKKVFPIHYGTFPLGLEPKKTDIEELKDAWKGENLDILIVGDFVEWNGNEFVAINNI